MARDSLTPKQQLFVDAYDGNATRAAISAGVPESSAASQGAKWLRIPKILAAIRARPRTLATIATREDRQRFWSETMVDSLAEMRDRLKASELLGKSEADFSENVILRPGAGLAELIAASYATAPKAQPAPPAPPPVEEEPPPLPGAE